MKTNSMNVNLTRISEFADYCRTHLINIDKLSQIPVEDSIEKFRKGNKIKIKKKNVGSFTRYCGGNVTEACIQRGKNSPSSSIRKKATFAANSRKWKH